MKHHGFDAGLKQQDLERTFGGGIVFQISPDQIDHWNLSA